MSDDRPSISRIIGAWLLERGQIAVYKDGVHFRKMAAGEERSDALNSLLQSLLKNGYDKDVICGTVVLNQIIDACTPPDHRAKAHKGQLEKWRGRIKEEWAFQLNEEFGKDDKELLAEAKERPKEPMRVAPEEEGPGWIPPKGKLDKSKFKGFETNPVFDEEFDKVLEGLKHRGE